MGFSQAIRTCLGRFATFSGRASRSEYWWFVLFVALGALVLSLIDSAAFGTGPEATRIFAPLWQLVLFIPLLAAGWRRLHDTGRPGWWLLVPMLVSLGFVVVLLGGVAAIGTAERVGANPEALRGPAAVLGVTGLAIASIVQLVLAVLMIWWLTRPGESGQNAYGRPPN